MGVHYGLDAPAGVRDDARILTASDDCVAIASAGACDIRPGAGGPMRKVQVRSKPQEFHLEPGRPGQSIDQEIEETPDPVERVL